MIRNLCLATLFVTMASPSIAQDRTASADAHGTLNALIAKHAAANNLPEALVRRVIKRESGGNPRAVSKGNYGLMQIRLGTARGLGYAGSAAGLLDADTNMTYAVKYLAGAYRVANGNHDRAVSYYASGYYYAAKRKGTTVNAAAGVDSFKGDGVADGNGGFAFKKDPDEARAVRTAENAGSLASEIHTRRFGISKQ
ncbi:MAG: transglycosylase SLT domain-containing protein [Pseudolabrys sp.]